MGLSKKVYLSGQAYFEKECLVLRIQTNIAASNVNRQLGMKRAELARANEKLSSGSRVNRSADDASGLAISEKIRSQIRGLLRASQNTEDGISMLKAADGALSEAHSVLHRMRELAVQGANDVLASEDRTAITDEINQLGLELDRIASTTNFNGKYILSGEYNDPNYWEPDSFNNVITLPDGDEIYIYGKVHFQVGVNTLAGDVVSLAFRGVTASDLLNGHLTPQGQMTDILWTPQDPDNPGEWGFTPNIFNRDPSGGLHEVADANDIPNHFGFQSLINAIDGHCPFHEEAFTDGGTTSANEFSRLTGIPLINSMRSELGAVMNRLEHTVANGDTVGENLQAAESRIRDADMAQEMMAAAKENMLSQSATAMLAQANQQPQMVLQLLQ